MAKGEASKQAFGKAVVADKMTRLPNRSESAELSMTASLGGTDRRL
jgi:hypothetical protein